MTDNRAATTPAAPFVTGLDSQGTKPGEVVVTAGQIALTSNGDSHTDDLVKGQWQWFENIRAIFRAAGAEFDDIVKSPLLLTDIPTSAEMNEVAAAFFGDSPPARTAIEIGDLPLDTGGEIEAIGVAHSEKEYLKSGAVHRSMVSTQRENQDAHSGIGSNIESINHRQ